MARKPRKTHDQFVNEVVSIHGNVYIYYNEYTKNNEPIKIQHVLCNHIWDALPTVLLDKRKAGRVYCPKCNGNVKLNTKVINQKLAQKKLHTEYIAIGEYNSGKKINITHLKCNTEFNTDFHSFLKNPRCPICDGTKIKTHEWFVQKVNELVGAEYLILEQYINSSTKIRMRHNSKLCNNNEYYVTPNNFVNAGNRCPICSMKEMGIKQRKTHEQFIGEIIDLVGANVYEFLSTFKETRKHIKLKHIRCNHIWEIRANDLLMGVRQGRVVCPNCHDKDIITTESFKAKIRELCGDEYIVTGEYVDSSTPLKIKHNIQNCSYEYSVTPNAFISRGSRCQKCYIVSRKMTHEEFEARVFNAVGLEYKIITRYNNARTKVNFIHDIDSCGYSFMMRPNDFIKNSQRCPICSRKEGITKTIKTHEQFEKDVIKIHGDVFEFLSEYKSSLDSISLRHKECGFEWSLPVATVLRKRYSSQILCPSCSLSASQGELAISKVLIHLGVKHTSEHTFNDCFYNKPLRFDFALFNKNENLECLIEYDGQHHFYPVDFAGKGDAWATEQFNETCIKDQIKNRYCNINNITLYRIPYWDFNQIEEIVNVIISKNNVFINEVHSA